MRSATTTGSTVTIMAREQRTDSTLQETSGEGGEKREKWGNQLQFFLYCLSYAVGFGNVWRFPYLCYKNGGAAFLIPYATMLLCAGLPLFFLELVMGQYVSLGPAALFPKLAPILSGLGWAQVVVSLLTAVYYNLILAWTLFYVVSSFASRLPWGHCDNEFNSPECFVEDAARVCRNQSLYYYNRSCLSTQEYCSLSNLTNYNETHCYSHQDPGDVRAVESVVYRISASEDFFRNRMLGVTGRTWEDMGGLRWELVGCLALAWVIVAACLAKGIKTTGKIVYFTTLFPYAVLMILFVRGVTLDGAYQGIEFYLLKPNVTRLMEVEVWNDAAMQIFYSLGICFGCLITLSSYNKFNNNCLRDAIVIAFSNCLTSVFTGFVIFSVLGFLAKQLGVEVKDVATSGSGLAFVVYPAALNLMPVPQLWAVLFFFMLATIGFGSQFTMVETVVTSLADQFEWMRRRKVVVVVATCVALFLLGGTLCLEGGVYMFELFFFYSTGISMFVLCLLQLFGVHYIYGFSKLLKNLEEMGMRLRSPLYWYCASTWLVITPGALIVIGFFSLYHFLPASWGDYVFPYNIQVLGWFLCFSTLICFPIGAIYAICTNTKGFRELFVTSPEFCPSDVRNLLKEAQVTSKVQHNKEIGQTNLAMKISCEEL